MWQPTALPNAARVYAARLTREKKAALNAIQRLWRQMNPNDFDRSWAVIAPQVVAVLETSQLRVGTLANDYIPRVMRETGQLEALEAEAEVQVESFVGLSGAGTEMDDVLSYAPVRAKQAVARGANGTEALGAARNWLLLTAGTALADTWRNVETTNMMVRPRTEGYVRMLVGSSCGRCAVLAGKWYRRNQGFQRHPGCDCVHIPSAEATAGGITTDINALFNSLDGPQQVKLMGSKANAQAVRDGADPVQIINAYRPSSVNSYLPLNMRPANVVWESQIKTGRWRGGAAYKYTMEGMSKRGIGYQAQKRYSQSKVVQDRLMPESIYKWVDMQNFPPALRQQKIIETLRTYGWII